MWKTDPKPVIPFSAEDLTTAAGMKAQIEWEQETRQRAQNETQRMLTGQAFPYTPLYYAWCGQGAPSDELIAAMEAGDEQARATVVASGRATLDPVTGTAARLYVLCAVRNSKEDCRDFEPKSNAN